MINQLAICIKELHDLGHVHATSNLAVSTEVSAVPSIERSNKLAEIRAFIEKIWDNS